MGTILGMLLFAAGSAAHASEYRVSLRLEDGLEERGAVLNLQPNTNSNAVLISTSGPRVETLIFNLMTLESADPRRVDLSYQFEWSRDENGSSVFVRQGMDWLRVPKDRDVLLLEVDERWRLWGRVGTAENSNCRPPPTGGGLKATVRATRDGITHVVSRQTSSGATSNLALYTGGANAFHLSLTPRVEERGKNAEVEYAVSWKTGAEEPEPATKKIPLGEETALEDGLLISLERIPQSDPALSAVFSARDPDTGWYRHEGETLSFSYPPEWNLRESCKDSAKPDGWNLTNRTEPENPLHGVHLWGFTLSQNKEYLQEDGDAELLTVKNGKCLVWRDEVRDPLCRENCAPSLIARAECLAEKEGGPHIAFNFDLGKESGLETTRYGQFLRFIKSFAF